MAKLFSQMSTAETEYELTTNTARGLDRRAVSSRLRTGGLNDIWDIRRTGTRDALKTLASDPFSYLLVLSALIGFAFGFTVQSAVLLAVWAIYFFAVSVSYVKARQVFSTVRMNSVPQARVIRDGRVLLTDSRRIVPGDILLLCEGDIVTADARVAEADRLYVYETAVTGSKAPAEKNAVTIDDGSIAPSRAKNILYASSVVVHGSGRAIVIRTGADCEAVIAGGRISAGKCGDIASSPVLRKARRLTGIIMSVLIFAAAAADIAVNGGEGLYMTFMSAVCLAAATMGEQLTVITEITAARFIAARALAHDRLSVTVKNVAALGDIAEVTAVVCTPDALFDIKPAGAYSGARAVGTDTEAAQQPADGTPLPGLVRFIASAADMGIKPIIVCDREKADLYASGTGAAIAADMGYIDYSVRDAVVAATGTASCAEIYAAAKKKGEKPLAVSCDFRNGMKMISSSGLSMTYAAGSYKTLDYRDTELAVLGGEGCQAIRRASDIMSGRSPENITDAVKSARAVLSSVYSASAYLPAVGLASALLVLLSVFTGMRFLFPTQILAGGLIFDFAALLLLSSCSESGDISAGRGGTGRKKPALRIRTSLFMLSGSAIYILCAFVCRMLFPSVTAGEYSCCAFLSLLAMRLPLFLYTAADKPVKSKKRRILCFSAFSALIALFAGACFAFPGFGALFGVAAYGYEQAILTLLPAAVFTAGFIFSRK